MPMARTTAPKCGDLLCRNSCCQTAAIDGLCKNILPHDSELYLFMIREPRFDNQPQTPNSNPSPETLKSKPLNHP